MRRSWRRGRERENVSFLPGRYFAVTRPQVHWVAIEFCGVDAGEHPAWNVRF